MILFKYIWYWTMWSLVKVGLHFYFSKIKVSGLDNIPKNTPIIFGSNHENAFIDALLITTSNTRFDHYLVRAGVFKNAIARAILNSLNLMPVYRAQDGVNAVEANKQIFHACFVALAKNYAIMLFPEGEHNLKRHRRVLKKGISRIALGAVNYEGGAKEVSVVPVGVNYSDHTGFRSTVHIVFGEPLIVKKQEETSENYNQLIRDFTDVLSLVHVSFDRKEYHGLDALFFHDLNEYDIVEPDRINQAAKKLEARYDELGELQKQVEELESGGLSFPFRPTSLIDNMKMFLSAPVALIGLLINLPVLVPVNWFVKTRIKEDEFIASLKFGFSLVGFWFWWWCIGSWIWDHSMQWTLVAIGVLLAVISLMTLNGFLRKWRRFRLTRLLTSDEQLHSKYQSFVDQVKAIRNELF